jgi:DNA helicase HerA-like ATPase
MVSPLLVARHEGTELALLPALANRHGLITGATGTGKTITLQLLAERFSAIGVPVFMADVKGDLSGLAAAGSLTPKLQERLDALGVDGSRAGGLPGRLLGRFRRAGTSGAGDDLGHGAGAACPTAEPQ